jgi:predicted aspartyl protease
MEDSNAEHSVVTKPVAQLTEHRATTVRATGTQTAQQFCQPWTCQLGGQKVTHEFLYLPKRPIPLLGRDLLTKLGAQITFT